MRGLANMRVTADIPIRSSSGCSRSTPASAFHDAERTIYLDGRAHPPDTAPHTWSGFSTGVYEGNMLTIKNDAPQGLLHPAQRRAGERPLARCTEHWISSR
jgi:hypothetical protein